MENYSNQRGIKERNAAMRAFVAIELSEKVISSIRKVQGDLKSYGFKVRWIPPENIHLTLKFLGNIHEEDIKKVGEAIIKSVKGFEPVSLTAKGIGVFPGINRPRVLWIGMGGEIKLLRQLHTRLDENFEKIGFQRENRPFRGHLTIGRPKGKGHMNPERLMDALKEFAGFESEKFITDRIVLFKSDLNPTGSVYTRLMSIKLTDE